MVAVANTVLIINVTPFFILRECSDEGATADGLLRWTLASAALAHAQIADLL
jgi:hypothetical protein